MCWETIKLAGRLARSLTVLLVALGACAASLAGHAGDASASALELATPTPLSALFAADPGAPNLTGAWEVVNNEGGTQSDTLTLTGPDTYTYSNGLGWWTTDVVISGSSATIWICGAGGTYSQADEDACPESTSGYWLEPWNFDLTPKPGDPYTAYGSYAAYNNGETSHTGTFTATGPTPSTPSPELSIAPATVAEPASGTHIANFTVSLSEASTSTVSVEYSTQDGTGPNAATAPRDYEATSGTLTFNPGETSRTIPITINHSEFSGKRTFTVGLSNAQEASIATGQATGTITAAIAKIVGSVLDTRDKPAEGITIGLTGTDEENNPVSRSAVTKASGEYSFEVAPGNYTLTATGDMTGQNGGGLTVLHCNVHQNALGGGAGGTPPPATAGTGKDATCALPKLTEGETAEASFTYTYCASPDRLPNGKPPTRCPIIFIPGFLGSRILCDQAPGELWGLSLTTFVDFADMLLEPDGETDAGASGSCSANAGPIPGQEGVVSTAALQDVYGKALDFINRIENPNEAPVAERGGYAFPYDWRKSPLITLGALDKEVDGVLEKTGASRVVLMAHSMGGLVTQAYIANPTYAKKVIRAITLGTPYWGAPKSATALMTAKSDEPKTQLFGLDLFLKAKDLQLAARNMLGLYWLFPSESYGAWLKVNQGQSHSAPALGGAKLGPWVASLGGTRALVEKAAAGHQDLDGFKTNEVDYQVLVGTGRPTITSEEVNYYMEDQRAPTGIGTVGRFPTQAIQIWFGSGDGTVPALSATQGAFEGRPRPLGDNVPIHYVCNIDHVSLPGNTEVQSDIEGFLMKGETVKGNEECAYTGTVTEWVTGRAQSSAVVSSDDGPGARISSAGSSMTLEQAATEGLIQLLQIGDQTIVVTDNHNPVTLDLSGKKLAFKVRSITSAVKGPSKGSGPVQYYGPVSGSLTVGATGVVRRAGKTLKAAHARRSPRTVARVTRHGRWFVVRLSARDPAGILATYVRIGKATVALYRKPLKLTRSQLKKLRFASVDRFGNWETSKKVHIPH